MRTTLLDEAWQLIEFTEKIKGQLPQDSYFQDTIDLAKGYPFMGSIFQEVER